MRYRKCLLYTKRVNPNVGVKKLAEYWTILQETANARGQSVIYHEGKFFVFVNSFGRPKKFRYKAYTAALKSKKF